MRCVLVIVALLLLFACGQVRAQGGSQTIALKQGWNAVFLEVEPANNFPSTVFTTADFANNPVQRVAMWMPNATSVQFISDPGQVKPDSPDWLFYYLPNSEVPAPSFYGANSTLKSIQGGRAYLIKIGGVANSTMNWTVTGTEVIRRIEWKPDSYNFTGFYLNTTTPGPTFSSWLASSTAHKGQPAYTINPTTGQWQAVTPASDKLAKGQAYWFMTQGASDYQGPVGVTIEQGGILDFGTSNTELTLTVKNQTTSPLNITLTPQTTSGSPGTVPLAYWDTSGTLNPGTGGPFVWTNLNNNSAIPLTLAGLEERPVRIRARRVDFPAVTAGTRLYSRLQIADATYNSLYDIPVYAQTVDQVREGLWVGDAVITAVSEHTADWNGSGYLPKAPSAPKPVGREFSYRIIVHVDSTGAPKLLGQALMLWKKPSQPVVLTTEARIKEYLNNMTNLSAPLGRRFTAPAFALSNPLSISAGTGFPAYPLTAASTMTFTVNLDHQDSRNPFKHKYHPDHDDLQSDFTTPQTTEGTESYTVTRVIKMDFTTQDPENGSTAGWGDTELGGTYTETVQGLMKDQVDLVVGPGQDLKDNKITATGYFRLKKVSDVDVLDPAY